MLCFRCGHCQAMADDWEKLGTEWEGHEVGLVGEVDCTDPISEDLCETIEGFPTLRFGDSDDLEEYEGGRSLEELFSFAKETLSTKMCSIKNIDICSDEKKTEIAKYQAMSSDELKGIIETEEAKVRSSVLTMYDKCIHFSCVIYLKYILLYMVLLYFFRLLHQRLTLKQKL